MHSAAHRIPSTVQSYRTIYCRSISIVYNQKPVHGIWPAKIFFISWSTPRNQKSFTSLNLETILSEPMLKPSTNKATCCLAAIRPQPPSSYADNSCRWNADWRPYLAFTSLMQTETSLNKIGLSHVSYCIIHNGNATKFLSKFIKHINSRTKTHCVLQIEKLQTKKIASLVPIQKRLAGWHLPS